MATRTVTWYTIIKERHTAEIPEEEYAEMIENGTYADELSEYEDVAEAVSVTDRYLSNSPENF